LRQFRHSFGKIGLQKPCSAHDGRLRSINDIKQEIERMKKIVAALFVAALVPTLAACNTVKGVGKDVQAGGEAVEDVAKDVEKEITE
jgi:entericidin B